ncbi:MAG: hypothetical protein PUB21_12730 [Bacteroidales bacterium]|nr:hypothetical protein [Bacteroidales bacterium]
MYRKELSDGKIMTNNGLLLIAVLIAAIFRVTALFFFPQSFTVELPIFTILGLDSTPDFPIAANILINIVLGILFIVIFQKGVVHYSLIRSRSLLPLFFALVLSSFNPNIANANLSYVLLLALTFIYFQLFDCYHDDFPQVKVFNISTCMSFLCLLDIRLLCLMPVFWYLLYEYKALTLKSFTASIIGLFSAFWLLGSYLLLTGDSPQAIGILFREFTEIGHHTHAPLSNSRIIYLAVIATTCTISILNSRTISEKLRIRTKLKSIRISLISVNMLSVFFSTSELLLAATIVPMSLLLGYFFSSSSGWLYKLLFMLFIAAIFTNFFFLLWKY